VLPSPPAASPTVAPNTSVPRVPASQAPPKQPEDTSSAPETSSPTKSAKYMTTRWTIIGAAIAAFILVVVVFGAWFCLMRYCKKARADDEFSLGLAKTVYDVKAEKPRYGESMPQSHKQASKGMPC